MAHASSADAHLRLVTWRAERCLAEVALLVGEEPPAEQAAAVALLGVHVAEAARLAVPVGGAVEVALTLCEETRPAARGEEEDCSAKYQLKDAQGG